MMQFGSIGKMNVNFFQRGLARWARTEILLFFMARSFKSYHKPFISLVSCNINTRFILQLLKLPTAEAAYFHLSMLIQRLARLMAVEHQVCSCDSKCRGRCIT